MRQSPLELSRERGASEMALPRDGQDTDGNRGDIPSSPFLDALIKKELTTGETV